MVKPGAKIRYCCSMDLEIGLAADPRTHRTALESILAPTQWAAACVINALTRPEREISHSPPCYIKELHLDAVARLEYGGLIVSTFTKNCF